MAEPTESRVLELSRSEWTSIVQRYAGAHVGRALWQVANTIVPLFFTMWVMYMLLDKAPWASALLVIPAAGFLVRTFIIMHDCAHASFLPWSKVNDALGFVTGVLTVTPFTQWRRDHALHHASSGDLDRRGHGDVPTITKKEYLARGKWGRLQYRLIRHPLSLMIVGPVHLMVNQRFRGRSKATKTKQLYSVWNTNLAIAAVIAITWYFWGAKAFFLVYLPSMYVAAAIGIWLFYVQHQFEDAYWEEHEEWDYATAAITGSSYLRLNPFLRWFTGSIGLHHVHHLGPKIPNYRLQRAHDENRIFEKAPVMTFGMGFRALRLALYDEEARRLIRFKDVPVSERKNLAA
ncbi:MAG: fatty acid desaturase [Gemmatimonadaceae bacterium]